MSPAVERRIRSLFFRASRKDGVVSCLNLSRFLRELGGRKIKFNEKPRPGHHRIVLHPARAPVLPEWALVIEVPDRQTENMILLGWKPSFL